MSFILIIGAASDIGRAIAHEYARNGYNLYLAARNIKKIRDDAADLKIRYRVMVEPYELDVLEYYSHEKFYAALPEIPLGVICVAGYLGDHDKAKMDLTELRKIIDTNFTGCISLLNICAREFEKRKQGFIVGISSVAGDRGRQTNYYYGSAKAGLTAFLSGLRSRLYRSNVSVLTVKPGYVYTKMTEGMNLPGILTAYPSHVASRIYKAQQKKKNIIYIKSIWRPIMLIIIHMPEIIFKRLFGNPS
jgi:decaprenylphospho-beta-D-erythro-pentofuranosid-2-ulose 2-reductase